MAFFELFNRRVTLQLFADDGTSFRWPDLRTSFRIEYAAERKPAKGRVEVFNQSASSRKWSQSQAIRVQLDAGYGSLSGVVFRGDVSRVSVERKPPEIVTTVEGGDGERAVSDTIVSISLGPNRSTADVLAAIVSALGLPTGSLSALKTPRIMLGGTTLNGPATQYLDQLADELDADWWIADGELQLMARNEALPGIAELVSPDTGLVGSPVELTKTRRNRTRVVGVKWRMLLRPDARPGKLYQLAARDFAGLYVARKVILTGDSGFDSAFYADIEANEVGV